VHRCSLGTAPLREVERWLERYRSREPQAERPPG
jgi:hypothetical protein